MTTPPIAEKRPKTLTLHGHERIDNYYWLREKESPDVLAYLEAENAYVKAQTAHLEDLTETIYQEMVGRIQETDSTVPFKLGDFFYYSRTVEGLQYRIHCRKHGSLDAPEQILLDENKLAEGEEYFKVGDLEMSPDQSLMAYSVDTEGGEVYTIKVQNVASGEMIDEIPNVAPTIVWANDNKTIFYILQDEAWRQHKIMRHTLKTAVSTDTELLHEPDELFNVYVFKTKDDAYLLLASFSIETSEYYFLDANSPYDELQLFAPRTKGVDYDLDHRKGEFYIRTNAKAQNFKLLKTAVNALDPENWQMVIPHNPSRLLQDFELFDDHLVVYGRFNGLRVIDIYEIESNEMHTIELPDPVYAVYGDINPTVHTSTLRISYTSLSTAPSVYDYDMNERTLTLLKQEPVLGGYDKENYVSERHFATAADGTQIPLSLLYKKGLDLNAQNPCLLYGYGSYGASMEPSFDQKRLSLVDRGFVYAIAHIRGGQEMGRHWYDNGKFLHKKNTFTDFIDCAKYLIEEKITKVSGLAINGRSAGGLLMGAVTTMAPELFGVVVAGVPFVDVVSTMLDTSIPLTVGEYEEWGNPNDAEYYHYMLSYSPYDNTTAQAYPHILITAGLNDPRVQYWEPAKWTAKLRDLKTNDNKLLLKTHMGAGHFSSSGRYDYLRDIAFEYAFILDNIE